ncbi:MAG: uncharacterized protein JWN48_3128 [Myxococcaceae bacterium]|nr:uncharacterized protein [Myxococcaceae bacterium]
MDLEALAPTGRLGGALARIPTLIDESGPAREGPPVPQNPAEVLALLMDFSGSVALAELLASEAPAGPSHPEAERLGTELSTQVRARLDALLPTTLKPLTGRRAPSVPPPHELLSLIRSTAGDGVPDAEGALRLARELGAPLRSALATGLRQAQAQVATLRWEIAHELRALGPRADRLERVDAALNRSIQQKLGELLDRMELAAELTFERACVHACAALPEDFGEAALASWGDEHGWLERYRERCVRMTKALFGHLRRSLEGLLRAAIHAERS